MTIHRNIKIQHCQFDLALHHSVCNTNIYTMQSENSYLLFSLQTFLNSEKRIRIIHSICGTLYVLQLFPQVVERMPTTAAMKVHEIQQRQQRQSTNCRSFKVQTYRFCFGFVLALLYSVSNLFEEWCAECYSTATLCNFYATFSIAFHIRFYAHFSLCVIVFYCFRPVFSHIPLPAMFSRKQRGTRKHIYLDFLFIDIFATKLNYV